ncbi:MAG: WYL domain-containing protein, partial [Lachnospiraceae bacterium]|nr:WYL domain-containing protein [Lachnospiraceae bacterium]
LDRETEPAPLEHAGKSFSEKLWGISGGDDRKRTADHLEMLIRAEEDEAFIVQRLQREKRCGTVSEVSPGCWKFEADVSDAMEMMPWIRTFIGRIISLKCSDPEVEERFRTDLERMSRMYDLT